MSSAKFQPFGLGLNVLTCADINYPRNDDVGIFWTNRVRTMIVVGIWQKIMNVY